MLLNGLPRIIRLLKKSLSARSGRYDLATGTIAPLEDDRKEWVVAEARRWLVLARRHVLAVLRYTTPSSVSERESFMATTRLPTSRRPI
jgi:hypothetical protein